MPRTDLVGRTVVIAGGSGYIGRTVGAALVRWGATIVVPVRSLARSGAIAAVGPPERVHLLEADISTETGAEALREFLVAGPTPTDAVAALGGWWEGETLLELDPAVWRQIIESGLTSHYLAARTLLPLLPSGGRYVLTGGVAAELAVAGSGPISVTGAAQRMLARVLAAETVGSGIGVHELMIEAPVVDTLEEGARQYPNEPILLARTVGERVASLLARAEPDPRLVIRLRSRTIAGQADSATA